MAFIEDHSEDCERLLGEPFVQVHEYLDELASIWSPDKYGEWHRGYRHNKAGVKYCLHTWGEKAAMAAKIHIVRDWYGMHMNNLNLVEILELADKLLPKLHIRKE